MKDIIGAIIHAMKLKARHFFAVFLLGFVLLTATAGMKEALGLTNIVIKYRGWISITTLASFFLWVVSIYSWFSSYWNSRAIRKQALEFLGSLSQNEKWVITYCLYKNQSTIYSNILEPETIALEQKGILIQACGDSNPLARPFTFPNYIWKELQLRKVRFLPESLLKNPGFKHFIMEYDKKISVFSLDKIIKQNMQLY